MSSIPIQFLIYVLPTPNCVQPPMILPLADCLQVQANVSVSFILYAMDFCDAATSIITDIIPTKFIQGLTISPLINSTTNSSLVYVTLTWTPQSDQIGSQEFCASAYTKSLSTKSYSIDFFLFIL